MIDAANYTLPIPVPFPGGAGGAAFAPNPVPVLGTALGTDVLTPGSETYVLVIVMSAPKATIRVPVTIIPSTCPTPTTVRPPVVNPSFTG